MSRRVRKSVSFAASEEDADESKASRLPWQPPPKAVVCGLIAVRLASAMVMHITDCDETFNYWEPTHFLLFGEGLQTWEYSPEYALRSYAYLGLHAAIGKLASFFAENKMQVFLAIRVGLALLSSLCELKLYMSLCRVFRRSTIPQWTVFFLMFSSGMFAASTAYLPSSFVMYAMMMAAAMLLDGRDSLVIFFVGLGALFAWPFCAGAAVPWGLSVLYRRGLVRTVVYGVVSLVVIGGPICAIDSHYYGQSALTWWNLINYNVLKAHEHGGSQLYGVEPWYFYIFNGILNFNVAFLLALVYPLVALTKTFNSVTGGRPWFFHLLVSPACLLALIFTLQPHKEERFLFVVYPLICVLAAVSAATCVSVVSYISSLCMGRFKVSQQTLSLALCAVVLLLSSSRTYGQYVFYHAPIDAYQDFLENELLLRSYDDGPVNVCVGKEWYRFPSYFFLPSGNAHLRFLRSDFHGLLPKPFEGTGLEATRLIPSHMNNLNKEEMSRYVSVDVCDYIVDLDTPGQAEERYALDAAWETIVSYPFLDASRSPSLTRAFYIPFVSLSRNTFNPYVVLRRKTRRGG